MASHGRRARVALIALLPLGFAALAAAGPGGVLPGSHAAPAERSMQVRIAAQETVQPTPVGVVASAMRPIPGYHTAPEPDASSSAAGSGNAPVNPAALVGDVVQFAPGPLGIPGIMLNAYKHAADLMAQIQPSCGLPWNLLAGIGKIESGHASGGAADSRGNTTTKILGPVLDGHLAGNAVITDTDGGAVDGHASYDRAVGPMQFMPGTWSHYGADGNNDGVADPNNVYDATFAAGRLLCASGGNLSDPAATTGAILTYNHSMAYVKNVQAWAHAYATGAYPTPSELPPISPDETAIDAPDGADPAPTPEVLPDPPAPPKAPAPETLPGTDIPATTVEVPGLPPVQLPKIELPKIELPCLFNCPPPPPPEPAPAAEGTQSPAPQPAPETPAP
ncbi:lytic transglycosylase domain-containing protein [Tomitella fengzijianii]|uniref:lytic transglycosylase domain-containing protein n=1 Tax=Tomitella fengzijianii TaxID=2597660 RepID=UPI001F4186A1|nr:lytic transglycosylase domain-containing protein [Tomitella fengzijianii]